MKRTALVTGATGQDGSYLCEQLLEQGYTVYALIRRSANHSTENIDHILDDLEVVEGDLTDSHLVASIVNRVRPDRIFNLAAQSHVGYSFKNPKETTQVNYLGVMNILEAVRSHSPQSRVLQASTSEMFGGVSSEPSNEDTPFYPRSPYGIAKLGAHWLMVNYRESYDLFTCSTICFNHSSKRRSPSFVARKATRSAAEIKLGLREDIGFGNIDTYRDWGYAPDYTKAMQMALDHHEPQDFVIATGETHCIRDMLAHVFNYAGLGNYEDYVYRDERFYRPAEVEVLLRDPSKAKKVLGWEPQTSFHKMIEKMYDNDLEILGD